MDMARQAVPGIGLGPSTAMGMRVSMTLMGVIMIVVVTIPRRMLVAGLGRAVIMAATAGIGRLRRSGRGLGRREAVAETGDAALDLGCRCPP